MYKARINCFQVKDSEATLLVNWSRWNLWSLFLVAYLQATVPSLCLKCINNLVPFKKICLQCASLDNISDICSLWMFRFLCFLACLFSCLPAIPALWVKRYRPWYSPLASKLIVRKSFLSLQCFLLAWTFQQKMFSEGSVMCARERRERERERKRYWF